MTTSHRATYNPAKGREGQGGYKDWKQSRSVSVLQMPSFTKLKTRKFDEEVTNDSNPEDLRKKLEEKEMKLKKTGSNSLMITDGRKRRRRSEEKVGEKDSLKKKKKSPPLEHEKTSEDSDDDSDSDEDLDDDSDSDSEDEEEERLLLLELEKLKKEKEEKEKKERMEKKLEEAKEIINSNPLLRQKEEEEKDENTMLVKRKWNEFSVFRNQALKDNEFEPKKKKRFINDTVRNDFHKKFLKKFIK